MKKIELRNLIKKSINEVLNETTKYAGKGAISAFKQSPGYSSLNAQAKADAEKELEKGGAVVAEMARIGINYKLAPDWENKLKQMPQYGREKPMKWIQGIIDYIKEKGPSTIPNIAKEKFGKTQLAIADYYRAMVKAGVITPENEEVIPQFQREPVEKEPADIFSGDVEDLFVGGKSYDGTEEEPEEEPVTSEPEATTEPEPGPEDTQLEPAEPISGGMSDEDYQAWMKYDDLKQKIAATKSNIIKLKKSKRRYDPEDIRGGDESNEVNRLIKFKKSLEDRINTLIAGSQYLQDKIAQEKEEKNKPESPSVEDVVDELDENQALNEWMMSKWKYYAGIKK